MSFSGVISVEGFGLEAMVAHSTLKLCQDHVSHSFDASTGASLCLCIHQR